MARCRPTCARAWASATPWCASPLASRTRTISSPTSRRHWADRPRLRSRLGRGEEPGGAQLEQCASFSGGHEPDDLGVEMRTGPNGAVSKVGRVPEPEVFESVAAVLVGKTNSAPFDGDVEV